MAITNAQILFNEGQRLLGEGILKPTGRIMRYQMPTGEIIEAPEPEPFHTFQAWKSIGYKVRKGEHAIARIWIWKYTRGKMPEDCDPEMEPAGHCIWKEACFFSASQVEKMA